MEVLYYGRVRVDEGIGVYGRVRVRVMAVSAVSAVALAEIP
jgi:hypothetical protein